MKTRHTLVIAAALMALSGGAQTTQKLSANKINEYGLIYTLPNTVIDVTIEAEKTVKTPGEFYQYAYKYLKQTPILEKSTEWSVKSVTVRTRGVANEEERYLVQFKSGSTPFMMLDNQDFPVSVNYSNVTLAEAPELPQSRQAAPTILQTEAASQAVTEEMIQSQSSAKRAEFAAAKIYELRQSRNDIISGRADQIPSDGAGMKLVLDNLARQEEALTAMFMGTVQTSTDVKTFTVTPVNDQEDQERRVLARISMLNGIVDADDLSGDPVYFNLKVAERGSLPENEKGETKRFPKGGLAYRIPGTADISVDFMDNTFWSGKVDVAQYGVVFGIDPNLFTDRKAPAYVLFTPKTGAIWQLGTVPDSESPVTLTND